MPRRVIHGPRPVHLWALWFTFWLFPFCVLALCGSVLVACGLVLSLVTFGGVLVCVLLISGGSRMGSLGVGGACRCCLACGGVGFGLLGGALPPLWGPWLAPGGLVLCGGGCQAGGLHPRSSPLPHGPATPPSHRSPHTGGRPSDIGETHLLPGPATPPTGGPSSGGVRPTTHRPVTFSGGPPTRGYGGSPGATHRQDPARATPHSWGSATPTSRGPPHGCGRQTLRGSSTFPGGPPPVAHAAHPLPGSAKPPIGNNQYTRCPPTHPWGSHLTHGPAHPPSTTPSPTDGNRHDRGTHTGTHAHAGKPPPRGRHPGNQPHHPPGPGSTQGNTHAPLEGTQDQPRLRPHPTPGQGTTIHPGHPAGTPPPHTDTPTSATTFRSDQPTLSNNPPAPNPRPLHPTPTTVPFPKVPTLSNNPRLPSPTSPPRPPTQHQPTNPSLDGHPPTVTLPNVGGRHPMSRMHLPNPRLGPHPLGRRHRPVGQPTYQGTFPSHPAAW